MCITHNHIRATGKEGGRIIAISSSVVQICAVMKAAFLFLYRTHTDIRRVYRLNFAPETACKLRVLSAGRWITSVEIRSGCGPRLFRTDNGGTWRVARALKLHRDGSPSDDRTSPPRPERNDKIGRGRRRAKKKHCRFSYQCGTILNIPGNLLTDR